MDIQQNNPVLSESLMLLNDWFCHNKRTLSFRENTTVYKTWVSETMLQQTTVQTVEPYFQRFLDKFPSLEILAQASLEEVLKLWAGLGYYSRAKNLHLCAQQIMKQGGLFPQNVESLIKLPGIGFYTAGAILSFGMGLPVPLVDTNVKRVLARIQGIDTLQKNDKIFWDAAEILVNQAHQLNLKIQNINAGLMELGALICKPKKIFCVECPLNAICQTREKNLNYLEIPYPKKKASWIKIEEYCLIIIQKIDGFHYVLVVLDSQKQWLNIFWDLPMISFQEIQKFSLVPIEKIHYTITHHKIQRYIVGIKKENSLSLLKKHNQQYWICLETFDDQKTEIALSSAFKKSLKKLKNLDSLF